jgi:glyoxylate/hydroxypyruvate reductase A
MSLAIICPGRDMRQWMQALQAREPELKVELWPEIGDPESVEFALVWKHQAGILAGFPNLRCISSLGAGVDALLEDRGLPSGVPLVRIVDEGLKQSMAEYVCLGALDYFRQFEQYRQQQAACIWQARPVRHISTIGVGILGLGELGSHVAGRLAAIGFPVQGWSRTRKSSAGIPSYYGDEGLAAFLAASDILVCLLPLTPATSGILNARLFRQLPAGAYVINVARGEHLVEPDLLAAIDSGRLSGALLDVFRLEPLPQDHSFWTHPRIRITPHIASITNPDSAVLQVLENYHRALSGRPLLNRVDPQRGY